MRHRMWLKRGHFVLLILLACSCLATLLWIQPPATWEALVTSVVTGIVYALAEYYSATLFIAGWVGPGIPNPAQPREIRIIMAEAPFGFALVALGPLGILPLCVATAVVTLVQRRKWRGAVFNTCLLALSYSVGLALLTAIVPASSAGYGTAPGAWGLLVVLGVIPLWDAWNFATLITMRSGRPYRTVAAEIFGPEVLIAGLPLAMGLVAGVFWHYNPWLVLPAAIPVLVAHRAFHAIARWSEEHAKAQAYARELEAAKTTLEDRVRERTQAVEQLMALRVREAEDAVHDLGHRVSAVETSVDLVQLQVSATVHQASSITRGFQRVGEAIAALRTQLQMVLDAALMQGGQVQMHPERLDPAALLAAVQQQLTARYHALACHLSLQLPTPPLAVCCDRVRLERVFFNLLDNAAKYAAHHAEAAGQSAVVRVTFSATETHIGCHIADNGPGFDEAALQRLGERGVRLGADPTRVEGNGLGLSFCFRALSLMDGSLQVASAGPGCGSTFTAWLPLAADTRPGGQP